MDFKELMSVAVQNKQNAETKKKLGYSTELSGTKKKDTANNNKGINSENVKKFLEKQQKHDVTGDKKILPGRKKQRSSSSLSESADATPEGIEDLFKTRNTRVAHTPVKKQLTEAQKREMQDKLKRVAMGIQNNDSDIVIKKPEVKDTKPKDKIDKHHEHLGNESSKDNKHKNKMSLSSEKSKKKKHKHDKDRERHRLGNDHKHEKHKDKHKSDKHSKVQGKNLNNKNGIAKKSDTKQPEKPKKLNRPAPPPMKFNDLLKMAESKQHEPIMIEKKVPEKKKRPMTQEEKERQAYRKSEEYKIWYKTGKLPNVPKDNSQDGTRKKSAGSNSSLKQNNKNETIKIETIKGASGKSSSDKSKYGNAVGKQRTEMKDKNKDRKEPIPLNPYMDFRDVSRPMSKSKSASSNSHKDTYSESNESVLVCGPSSSGSGDADRQRIYNHKDRERHEPEESPWDRIYNQVKKKHAKPYESQKRRIESESEESEYDEELDDFIASDDEDDGYGGGGGYSSVIKNIFGYDRNKYQDEDDDIDDMETRYSEQVQEERISTKLGKKEDLEDIQREAEHKKRKMMLKKQAMKKLKR